MLTTTETADTAPIKLTGKQEKALRDYIDSMLRSNPLAVERAMVRLFELQTADEKAASDTKHHNNRGFNSSSASAGSFFARIIMKGMHLRPENLERATRIALRHSRQLVDIMVAKQGAAAALKMIGA